MSDDLFCERESQNSWKCIFWYFRRFVLQAGDQILWKCRFEISDVLFCAQESETSWKSLLWDFRRFVLRTGVQEFLTVHLLRLPTFCSAHRSPRILESPFLRFPTFCLAHRSPITESLFSEISVFLFCAQESQKSWKFVFWYFQRFVLPMGVP